MKQSPMNSAKTSERRLTVVLALAVVAAIAIALATTRTSHGAGVLASDSAPSDPPASDSAPEPAQDTALSGEVLESIPVSKYTYLRLRSADGEVWAAVPSASVAIGSRVAIANATRMDDFKSATLGRIFKVIYFGTLGSPAAGAATDEGSALKYPVGDEQDVDSDQPLPPGHPVIGANAAPGAVPGGSTALPSGHPDIGNDAAGSASPHGGTSASPDSEPLLTMPKIARAVGGNGHVIAELAVDRQQLAGQHVRVRGQVTKVTPDIQGRAFFHLRDASVSGKGPVAELVVTSVTTPTRGQVATFEGTLRADDDIGIGYKYPVLLEDATVVGE